MRGIIFDIKRFAIHDGPGIRTTVFFQGCPLDCHWCHNPESRAFDRISTNPAMKMGRSVTIAEVLHELEKEILFFDESGGGVTCSGGEPLMQPDFLAALLEQCKQRDIHTALDTTGYCAPAVFNTIIDKVDLFLYDLKIFDDQAHQHYTGVSNAWIKENLRLLASLGKAVILRFPVIPGLTDHESNIAAIGAFATELKSIHQIDLLPYHRTAEAKYKRLQIPYRLSGIKPHTDAQLAHIKHLFEQNTDNIYINKE